MEHGIEHLCQLAGAAPSDIVMHCGVSICGSCYEVGPEVHERVTGVSVTGPTRLDLRTKLLGRAAALGVEGATSSSWCTVHDSAQFYSHRASAGAAGRMVAYIGRPNT
jgi:copper oxidase (laccase) domain-containing protein